MVDELADKLDDLAAVCRRLGIDRLELVGSATGVGDRPFDPQRSDFDFLVVFGDPPPGVGRLNQYLDAIEAIENAFDRPAQMIDDREVKNPYLRRSLDRQRRPLVVRGEVVVPRRESICP